jgi:hypothetical protein
MVDTRKKDAKVGKIKENKKIRVSNVAFSNPQLIEISLYEIQSFLIAENTAKFVLIFGSLFVGGVISAIFSKIVVSTEIIIFSSFLFVSGLLSDIYITHTKFKELKEKGAKEWQ